MGSCGSYQEGLWKAVSLVPAMQQVLGHVAVDWSWVQGQLLIWVGVAMWSPGFQPSPVPLLIT